MNKFHPSSQSARSALEIHTNRIKRSITHSFNVLERDIGFSHPQLDAARDTVYCAHQFHPETHYYHYKLLSSMKNNAKEHAICACDNLINCLIDRHYGDCIQLGSIGDSLWEREIIKYAVESATAETGINAWVTPVETSVLVLHISNLRAGFNILEQHHSDAFYELQILIRSIKLFTGKVTQGLTDTRVFGEIYVRVPRQCVDPVPYYVEHVVHETAHSYLNCLMVADPIVLNRIEDRFPSPLRKDTRPMYAVFHATFVAARMALTFKSIFVSTEEFRWQKLLAEVSDETVRGLKTIREAANLTAYGQAILVEIEESLQQIAAMPSWRGFDFGKHALHRCGAGHAQYSAFHDFLRS